jgi:hypothetical protein
MHKAISQMLSKYQCRTVDDYTKALREIMQEIALLGLWRRKFFEHTAFYGGTSLRILYGLDRYSEDLDFSLLRSWRDFDLFRFIDGLEEEIYSFGFDIKVEKINKAIESPIQSAFLKANTRNQLLSIEVEEKILSEIPKGQILKIKLEVDIDPPPGFSTQSRYLLMPIPFAVRAFILPDLFAGKMHAFLCRGWKSRVKGRDWYDFVWFVTHHPELNLSHLEQRMLQTGHWSSDKSLSPQVFHRLLKERIESLDVETVRREVEPYVKEPEALTLWTKEFFIDIATRIVLI